MRNGQQHMRRGRGRNNNNNNSSNQGGHNNNRRHHQNPLTRSFESNGPDVKIRGNPMHIAEKYIQLARDAQSAGDPVLAENYLQHAEHYNRIIMAHRDQMASQGESAPFPRPRQGFGMESNDGMEDGGDDQMDDGGGDDSGMIRSQPRGQEPQPRMVDGGQPQPSSFDEPGFGGGRRDRDRDQQQHNPMRSGRDQRDQRDPPREQRDPRDGRDGRDQQQRDQRDNRPDNGRGQQRRPFRDRYQHEPRQNGGDRPLPDRFGNERNGGDQRHERQPHPERIPIDQPMIDAAPAPQPEMAPFEPRPVRAPAPERQPIVDREPAPLPPPPMIAERIERPEPAVRVPRPRAERARREPALPPAAEPGFDAQPDFLRRPVRRPRREAAPVVDDASGAPAATGDPVAPDKPVT